MRHDSRCHGKSDQTWCTRELVTNFEQQAVRGMDFSWTLCACLLMKLGAAIQSQDLEGGCKHNMMESVRPQGRAEFINVIWGTHRVATFRRHDSNLILSPSAQPKFCSTAIAKHNNQLLWNNSSDHNISHSMKKYNVAINEVTSLQSFQQVHKRSRNDNGIFQKFRTNTDTHSGGEKHINQNNSTHIKHNTHRIHHESTACVFTNIHIFTRIVATHVRFRDQEEQMSKMFLSQFHRMIWQIAKPKYVPSSLL